MQLKQVVLIGAGNVGYHLGHRFHDRGIKVAQVFSRDIQKAQELAESLESGYTNKFDEISALQDCLYLMAVKDDAISTVAHRLRLLSHSHRLFAHTSGAISSQILAEHFQNFGVFYPLQTFSKGRPVDFNQLPICIYASNQVLLSALDKLGRRISQQVQTVDDNQRSVLHVAAVFVNNFTNHLFGIGQEIVDSKNLSFDLLRPLVAETAAKIMENDPQPMQTGPAVRGDQETILSHLSFLQSFPEYQNLYRIISHSIEQTKA